MQEETVDRRSLLRWLPLSIGLSLVGVPRGAQADCGVTQIGQLGLGLLLAIEGGASVEVTGPLGVAITIEGVITAINGTNACFPGLLGGIRQTINQMNNE